MRDEPQYIDQWVLQEANRNFQVLPSFSSLLLSRLELSDTKVYEP